jgi:predicted transglutaminase-like cysteine proteinase
VSFSARALAFLSAAIAFLTLGAAAHADQIAALAPDTFTTVEAGPRPRHPPIFNTREIHSVNVAQFTNWTDMLARWQRDQSAAATCPAGGAPPIAAATPCVPAEWRELVQELNGLPRRTLLQRVNTALNRHPYTTSIENWGVANHWETPYEFLRRSGQCQDYAIAKFMLLRALGVPNEDLRIVVLRDVQRGLDHAVVVAYVDGEALMLDSLREAVVPVDEVGAYRPYYSINETGWWLHLGGAARPQMASRRAPARMRGAAEPSEHVVDDSRTTPSSARPETLRLSMIEALSVN